MPQLPALDAATPGFVQPHAGTLRQRLFTPMNLAAYATWLVIVLAVVDPVALGRGDLREWTGAGCLLAFLAVFLSCAASTGVPGPGVIARVLLQAALVVLAEACLVGGQTAVLLIIVAVQVAVVLPVRAAAACLIAVNAAIAGVWLLDGYPLGKTLLTLTSIVGFQVFAALTGHYAVSREQAREHLARVNAELMATRLLLEESARAGERLKLSRELHDVAGHSLTALKLNLARLARDPALAGREELATSTALADELLAQIRQVVGALRAHDGLDLRAAFEALARPMPGVRIDIEIDDGLRVDDIDQAETLLRSAQEAITNALRHGRAQRIGLRLQRDGDAVALVVDNDGAAPAGIVPGNGLTGMRERIEALGGTLEVAPTPPRGLRLRVRLPERVA